MEKKTFFFFNVYFLILSTLSLQTWNNGIIFVPSHSYFCSVKGKKNTEKKRSK